MSKPMSAKDMAAAEKKVKMAAAQKRVQDRKRREAEEAAEAARVEAARRAKEEAEAGRLKAAEDERMAKMEARMDEEARKWIMIMRIRQEETRTGNIKTKRDAFGHTPLLASALTCRGPVVAGLLEKGADLGQVDAHGNNALMLACGTAAQLGVVRVLLGLERRLVKHQLRHRNKAGWGALTCAAAAGVAEAVELCCAAGADVRAACREQGRAPLHYAAGSGSVAAARALARGGAPVGACDNDGRTPLMLAAAGADTDMVESLLELGADLEQQSDGGLTALMVASVCGHEQMTNLLCAKGALTTTESAAGSTSRKFASVAGHSELAVAIELRAEEETKRLYLLTDEGRAAGEAEAKKKAEFDRMEEEKEAEIRRMMGI